jgi:hypothetical protein
MWVLKSQIAAMSSYFHIDPFQFDFASLTCKNTLMATLDGNDLEAIKDVIEMTIDEKELVSKDDIGHLPTKDEFYEKMDEVMGELKVIREEQTVQSHQLSNHEDRLQKNRVSLGFVFRLGLSGNTLLFSF